MNLRVSEIAAVINARFTGDGSRIITGVSSFDDARETDLTFAADPGFLSRLPATRAGAVVVPIAFEPDSGTSQALLRVEKPKLAFFRIVEKFHPKNRPDPGIHPTAMIGRNCILGRDVIVEENVVIRDNVALGDHVHIMPNVYVGEGCTIKNHSLIKPNTTLMEQTRIGSNVIIHSGSVIGSDGFGFVQDAGAHAKLPHTGFVEIGDNAEIGACNTIDRGTLGRTVIGSGVKTDNQVHIAHNVKIGENTLVVAQVGIAGSTTVGSNVILAGKAGVTGHITIGNNAIVGPYAGVSADVAAGEIVSGVPHMPHKTWLKVANIVPRLPEMRKKLLSIEKKLKNLEQP